MATKKKSKKKNTVKSKKAVNYSAVVTDEPPAEGILTTSGVDEEGNDSRYFASWVILEILSRPDNIDIVNSIFDTCSDEENVGAQEEFYMAAQVLKSLSWKKPFPDDIFGPCDVCGPGGCFCRMEETA